MSVAFGQRQYTHVVPAAINKFELKRAMIALPREIKVITRVAVNWRRRAK